MCCVMLRSRSRLSGRYWKRKRTKYTYAIGSNLNKARTDPMRYLTLSELIYINGTILNNKKILSGTQEIRDIALLEAAAARPASSAFGQDAYPTLNEKVAALVHSIQRYHPFTDGIQSRATVAAHFIFESNVSQS